MDAQLSFGPNPSRRYFPESGSGAQTQPNPLRLTPIATAPYIGNHPRQSHCTYLPYFQHVSREKGPVFDIMRVTPPKVAGVPFLFQPTAGGCNRDATGRRLGERLRAKLECRLESAGCTARLPHLFQIDRSRRPVEPAGVVALNCVESAGGLS